MLNANAVAVFHSVLNHFIHVDWSITDDDKDKDNDMDIDFFYMLDVGCWIRSETLANLCRM